LSTLEKFQNSAVAAYLGQKRVHAIHSARRLEHLLSPVEHDRGSHVQWHQRRRAQEKVVHPNHSTVFAKRVTKPGQKPWQGKQGASFGPVQQKSHILVQDLDLIQN
jgi:hypothetical protein